MWNSDNNYSRPLKFVKRCQEKYLNNEFVDDEGNSKLLKLEKQYLSSLLMHEEYCIKETLTHKCFDQRVSKYAMNATTRTCSWTEPTKIQQTLDPGLGETVQY